MKITLEKYLIYSSTFIIFSEGLFFNYIIDWKLMYLIILINYILLLSHHPLKINIAFKYLILFVIFHAVLCYSIILIPPNYFISQVLGVTITSLYFYNILSIVPISEVKKAYLKLSFYVAILGYIFYFIGYNPFAYFQNEKRLMSIFKEPAHYVVVIFPACYYFLKQHNFTKFLLIFITILLSASSLGYIGIGIMFLFYFIKGKRIIYFLSFIPVLVLAFILTYENVPFFKLRVDDSITNLNVINNGKFDPHTNMSSYVLLSNIYIAKQNIIEHPLGSGIGSHHHMYTKHYYKNMRPPEYLKTLGHDKDNSFDANSLITRISSEFGILGFLFLIFIIYYFQSGLRSEEYLLHGIFIYILLKLFRDGTYFPPELFFFVWLFYFIKKENQQKSVVLLN